MNRSSIFILSVAAVLGMAVHVRSQAPGPKSPVQQIQEMKAVNKTTLEKQTALLLQLDELQKQAAQIKFLAKRG